MTSAVESLFELLFKYRPVVFEQGQFAFGMAGTFPYVAGVVALVAAAALVTYARVGRGRALPRRDRAVLTALRLAVLATLVVCLFRPRLLLSTAVPQRNYVGVLLDDSRSMQVADLDGKPRADVVRQNFDSAQGAVMKALAERFRVRTFRFSEHTERVSGAGALTFAGRETHLGDALDETREALSGVPLSGLVVVTDGADNARTPMAERLLALRAHGVPVYTVGIGREKWTKDIEIRRVDAPRQALEGSSLVVDVLVAQQGYEGATVPVLVEDQGRIVGTQQVKLPDGREAAPVRVTVAAREAGPRTLTVRIPAQPGEMVTQNNASDAMVHVRDGVEKILYVEGEPRWEAKFLRQAVQEDSLLQVVLLQRTADHKFLRLAVDHPEELAGGFPQTREELFRYRAVILGSIEASAFTPDQLRMLADFVSERGGTLVALGGRRSFAEGGYVDTPLADVLPFALERVPEAEDENDGYIADLKAEPTPAGRAHPATQLGATDSAAVETWKRLPPVTAVNVIKRLKPGAVALLTGRVPNGGRGAGTSSHPVLAWQPYGRGRALGLGVQDSWMWQMHADVEPEDMSHETFWRQLLRWAVAETPERVTVALSSDDVAPRQPVTVRAEVRDGGYVKLNDANVVATVRAPSGAERTLPMTWTVDRDGEYRATFTPEEAGNYQVTVQSKRGADTTAQTATTFMRAAEPRTEYFGAEMRASLLKRVAEETGGRFYTPANLASLPEDLMLSTRGVTVVREMELWDMPIVLLLLLGLVGAEWGYRKVRGLA